MERDWNIGFRGYEQTPRYEPETDTEVLERLDNIKIGLSSWYQAYLDTGPDDMQAHVKLDGDLDDLGIDLKYFIQDVKGLEDYHLQLRVDSVPAGLRELRQMGDDKFELFDRLDGIASLPALPVNYVARHSAIQDRASTMPQPDRYYDTHQLHIGNSRRGIVIPLFPLIEALEGNRASLTIEGPQRGLFLR